MICGVGDNSFIVALPFGVSIRGEVGLQNILAGANQSPAQAPLYAWFSRYRIKSPQSYRELLSHQVLDSLAVIGDLRNLRVRSCALPIGSPWVPALSASSKGLPVEVQFAAQFGDEASEGRSMLRARISYRLPA
jgi:hypothetical protein